MAEGVSALEVMPNVKGMDKILDYLPAPGGQKALLGDLVRVELGPRKVDGWVVGFKDPTVPLGQSVKPITKVLSRGPDSGLVGLATWAAWRWSGHPVHFLAAATPEKRVHSTRPDVTENDVGERAIEIGREIRSCNPGPQLVVGGPNLDPFPWLADLASSIEPGTTLLVLAPNAGYSERLSARFRTRGFSCANLPDQWEIAYLGVRVVVGTRGAAWAPMPRLGAAVVLDAHEDSYTDSRSPTWNAGVLLAERAKRDGCRSFALVPAAFPEFVHASMGVSRLEEFLGSKSRETERGKNLPAGVQSAGEHLGDGAVWRRSWTRAEVVDLGAEDPRNGLLTKVLARVIAEGAFSEKDKLLILFNRVGYARLLACAACKSLVACDKCRSTLIAGSPEELMCPRCGLERPMVCESCGSISLKNLRVGVNRFAEQVALLAKGRRVVELTAKEVSDISGGKVLATGAKTNEKESLGLDRAEIVVGTEAVFSRLRRASIVVIADFDQQLFASRLNSKVEAVSILAKASRAAIGGRLILQTRSPGDEVVSGMLNCDFRDVFERDDRLRQELRLPPYSALAVVSGPGGDDVVSQLREQGRNLEVSGPDHTGRWLIRACGHKDLCDSLSGIIRPVERVRIEVDPLNV